MSRRKKAENCVLLPWLSANANCREKRFLQVGNTMFFSKEWKSLSLGARYLYLAMALDAGTKRVFLFPLSSAKKYSIPSSSFRNYVNELTRAEFITKRSGACTRQCNEYAFCNRWKLDWKPVVQQPPLATCSKSVQILDKQNAV